MKILGIIPARAGSKRIPRKNLMTIGQKPLVEWVMNAALECKTVGQWMVSSDDDEVLAIAARQQSERLIPLRRPANLADDRSPAIDYVRHAIGVAEAEGSHVDVVVIIQATSPFTLGEDIDRVVNLLVNSGADTAVSVMEVDHAFHPIKLKVMTEDRLLPFVEEERGRMATHELPTLFVRNCSVYATRRGTVDQGSIIGVDCRGYVMPKERSIDINDPLDLDFAEFIFAKYHQQKPVAQGTPE